MTLGSQALRQGWEAGSVWTHLSNGQQPFRRAQHCPCRAPQAQAAVGPGRGGLLMGSLSGWPPPQDQEQRPCSLEAAEAGRRAEHLLGGSFAQCRGLQPGPCALPGQLRVSDP